MSDSLTLNDGRSAAFAVRLARAMHAAVPAPHLAAAVRQAGYGPAWFEVAILEEDGRPGGRFATVTVAIHRDAKRAEHLAAELAQGGARP